MKLRGKGKQWVAGYLVVLLVVLFTLGSCRTPAGRSAGEVLDDATITTKVKAKLFDENILRGMAIGHQCRYL